MNKFFQISARFLSAHCNWIFILVLKMEDIMEDKYGTTCLTVGDKMAIDSFVSQLSSEDKEAFSNLVKLSTINYVQKNPGEALDEYEIRYGVYHNWHVSFPF